MVLSSGESAAAAAKARSNQRVLNRFGGVIEEAPQEEEEDAVVVVVPSAKKEERSLRDVLRRRRDAIARRAPTKKIALAGVVALCVMCYVGSSRPVMGTFCDATGVQSVCESVMAFDPDAVMLTEYLRIGGEEPDIGDDDAVVAAKQGNYISQYSIRFAATTPQCQKKAELECERVSKRDYVDCRDTAAMSCGERVSKKEHQGLWEYKDPRKRRALYLRTELNQLGPDVEEDFDEMVEACVLPELGYMDQAAEMVATQIVKQTVGRIPRKVREYASSFFEAEPIAMSKEMQQLARRCQVARNKFSKAFVEQRNPRRRHRRNVHG
jgi:hypothetical protein